MEEINELQWTGEDTGLSRNRKPRSPEFWTLAGDFICPRDINTDYRGFGYSPIYIPKMRLRSRMCIHRCTSQFFNAHLQLSYYPLAFVIGVLHYQLGQYLRYLTLAGPGRLAILWRDCRILSRHLLRPAPSLRCMPDVSFARTYSAGPEASAKYFLLLEF